MDKKCERKIVYLDYMERGKKIKNGGFCRWDINGDICKILLHVQGLYNTDTLSGEVQLLSRGVQFPVGKISLQSGRGEFQAIWNTDKIEDSSIGYYDCESIIVHLSDSRFLQGVIRELVSKVQIKEEEIEEKEIREEVKEEQIKEEETKKEIEEEISVIVDEPESEQTPVIIQEPVMPEIVKEESSVSGEARFSEAVPTISDVPFSLSGDKWQQLRKQFTGVTPFDDGREYLSITPRDFTILPGKYQPMVQNSFLLHGYYNYGHVVLVREKDRVEDKYFLGVPGVYYDREKQAALMFGFESFESGSTKTQDGGFGYYFKRVEI